MANVARAMPPCAVLLLGVRLASAHTGAHTLSSADSDKEWKEHPVGKVVKLLQDMMGSLEEESKKDQELYDKLACWCETNDQEKTKAIETADQRLKQLTSDIESNTAKAQQLTTDIKNLNAAVASNMNGLAEATSVREKELAEFNQDDKDTISSLQSLKGALTTLGKNQGGASAALVQLTHALRRRMKSHPEELRNAVAPHQRRLLFSLLQQPEGMVSLLQKQPGLGDGMDASGATSYSGQSGEIFGMLQQMKETFETNSVTAQKEEAKAVEEFVQLKAAKEKELKASKELILSKTEDSAKAQDIAATSTEDKDDTEKARAADTAFLAGLKKTCSDTDSMWDARQKTRQEEMKAVSDTIAFLNSDEAHDLMSRSTGFIQLRVKAKRHTMQREQARKFLEEAGERLNSPRLSYLATRMRFDPFGKMRESIDTMTGALGKEGEDEIVYKDDCVGDLNTNEKDTLGKNEHKTDLDHEIAFLETEIVEKTDEEKRLGQEIMDAQIELKKAGDNRESENKEFQVTISDQRATQKILDMAVARLQEFYGKSSLLQRRARTAKQEPGAAVEAMPEGLGEYKKSNGGGAVALIQGIIADSKAVEKEAMTAETDAQSAYEAYVQDTNKEIEMKERAIVNDEETLAKDKIDEVEDETDKRGTVKVILKLGDTNQGLHKSCDFTLDNFDVRQSARNEEIEALKQSKAIFSGAGFGR